MQNYEEETTSAPNRRLEEYRHTQSILAETLEIGRGVAEQVSLQQSSLDRAQEIVAETEYYVATSNRWIRGRTWAGWITNLLTSPPLPPSTSNSNVNQSKTNSAAVVTKTDDYSRLYDLENFPPSAWKAVQSVQNYHSHVLLLLTEQNNDDNFSTLVDVCQRLQSYAEQQLQDLREDHPTTHSLLRHQMEQLDFKLNQCHPYKQVSHRAVNSKIVSVNGSTADNTPTPSLLQQQHQQQEKYLNSLLPGLEELQSLSEAIGSSIHHQNQMLETLNQKTEELTEQTQVVIRRSERFIDKNSYNSIFQSKRWELRQDRICILHCTTNQYICLDDSSKLTCTKTLSRATVFHLFQCKQYYAFQNIYSRKWLGIAQSFFGTATTVSCSATTLGSHEVWEFDDSCITEAATTTTRLLSSNANWGTGGYIQLQENNSIALQRKNSSYATTDLWKIIPC